MLARALQYPSHPSKLIVGLSAQMSTSSSVVTPARLAVMTTSQLLLQCKPSPSDIHDPANGAQARSPSRQKDGRARRRNETVVGRQHHLQRCRSHETWDTDPFQDFMGKWCSRLWLGDDTQTGAGGEGEQQQRCVRAAVFEPYGDYRTDPLVPHALSLVLQVHRQLRAEDLLLVVPCLHSPLGSVTLEAEEQEGGGAMITKDPALHKMLSQCRPALTSNGERKGPWLLRIGASYRRAGGGGGDAGESQQTLGLRDPIPLGDLPFVAEHSSAVGAFACALWASAGPHHTKRVLEEKRWLSVTAARRAGLLRSLQQSMLSTRDTVILQSYAAGVPPSPRMSDRTLTQQAHTLLDRLERQQPSR